MCRRTLPTAGPTLLCLLLLLSTAGTAMAQEDSASAASESTERVEVTGDAPPPVHLAFFDTKMLRIPTDTVEAYRQLLDELSMTCRYSQKQMAGLATSAVRALERHSSKTLTTRQLLSSLNDNVSASLSTGADCVTVVTSILQSVGGEKVANHFMPTEAPGGIDDPGGGGGD